MINLSRSLGDLWSYNIRYDKYHVSPVPDVLSAVQSCLRLSGNSITYLRWPTYSENKVLHLHVLIYHSNIRNSKSSVLGRT